MRLKILIIAFSILVFGVTAFFYSSGTDAPASQEAVVFQFKKDVYSTQSILGEGYQKFTHPIYNFSVEYPDTFITEAFQEVEGGETIVFQTPEADPSTDSTSSLQASSGQGKNGFQIFIIPFGEDEVITRERILEDIPFVTIDEPQEVVIGDPSASSGQEIRALLFWSEDPSVGRTRAVWFVHDGNLYEITTYAHLDSWLANVLSSWKFERKDKK